MAALRISLGVVLWALHFTVIYGFTALACARGFGASVPWFVGGATVVAAAAATAVAPLTTQGAAAPKPRAQASAVKP